MLVVLIDDQQSRVGAVSILAVILTQGSNLRLSSKVDDVVLIDLELTEQRRSPKHQAGFGEHDLGLFSFGAGRVSLSDLIVLHSCNRDLIQSNARLFLGLQIVIVMAFYPSLLAVTSKFSIHFQLRRYPVSCRTLVGRLYSAFAVSLPMRYNTHRCYTVGYLGVVYMVYKKYIFAPSIFLRLSRLTLQFGLIV